MRAGGFALEGHLAMPKDIFGCHDGGEGKKGVRGATASDL